MYRFRRISIPVTKLITHFRETKFTCSPVGPNLLAPALKQRGDQWKRQTGRTGLLGQHQARRSSRYRLSAGALPAGSCRREKELEGQHGACCQRKEDEGKRTQLWLVCCQRWEPAAKPSCAGRARFPRRSFGSEGSLKRGNHAQPLAAAAHAPR